MNVDDTRRKERVNENRRVARLYGSKHLPAGREIHPSRRVQIDSNATTCDPFESDRKPFRISGDSETRESIVRFPWLVGYRNTVSIQGSPSAISARYGFNGAIRITRQCSDRFRYGLSFMTSDGTDDKISAHNVKSLSMPESKCNVPRISDGANIIVAHPMDQLLETKIYRERVHLQRTSQRDKRNTCFDNQNSKQLARVYLREHDMWANIVTKAKEERRICPFMSSKKRGTRLHRIGNEHREPVGKKIIVLR